MVTNTVKSSVLSCAYSSVAARALIDMFSAALDRLRDRLAVGDREGLEAMFRLSTKRREAFDKK